MTGFADAAADGGRHGRFDRDHRIGERERPGAKRAGDMPSLARRTSSSRLIGRGRARMEKFG
jgi:hypothetical protein